MQHVALCFAIVVALPLFVAHQAAADDFEKARHAISENRLRDAIDLLKPRAAAGNARAQTMLGRIYLKANGRFGVRRDKRRARVWLERAARQDHVPAIRRLGIFLIAQTQEKRRGYLLLRKAALRNDAGAQSWLGYFMVDRHNYPIPGSEAEGRQWLLKGARQKHHVAIDKLAHLEWHNKQYVEGHKWELIYSYLHGPGFDAIKRPFAHLPNSTVRMSKEQIAEARRRALDWLRAHGESP